MKTLEEINEIMKTIPERWRTHWCKGIELEGGGCACRGCVQIGNRLIMASKTLGKTITAADGDPEHIDERKIPIEIFNKYKITKEEWEVWSQAQND